MRKLIAYAFVLMMLLGNLSVANMNEETGLGVVEQEVVVVQPVEPILTYRERLDQQVSRGEIRSFTAIATAYTHTGDATFTGIMPYVGVIAVDPRVIPLGSRVYVEGYGEALAADTGGLIKGTKIDLFMDTEQECDEWGIQPRKIYIIGR